MNDVPEAGPASEVAFEPEKPRRSGTDYFRDRPSAFFAWLGGIVFVGGWATSIYVFVDLGDSGSSGFSSGIPFASRLQNLVSFGVSSTLAAGVLWGVAAYLWVNLLPSVDDES